MKLLRQRVLIWMVGLAAATVAPGAESTKAGMKRPGSDRGDSEFILGDLLPTAWQKRPKVRFKVFTEMTPAGRERPEPSAAKPLRYYAAPGTFAQTGWAAIAGEKPPPWEQLQASMEEALATNGFLRIPDDHTRPDLLIVFNFGSFSTDIASLAVDALLNPIVPPPMTAEELMPWLFNSPLRDPKAIADVIERSRFIGGPKVAGELREALLSPFGDFSALLNGAESETTREVVELAFHSCYFVTASAFDFAGVEKKQRQLLWQTRMTVDANGLDLREVLKPLIISTGPMLGRETPEAVTSVRRIEREGNVQIGTLETVKEERKP